MGKADLIGLYDSGMGGLSVMRSVHTLLPTHNLIYLADTAYCPYGPRPIAEVQSRAVACTAWLISQGAQLVVVACNTASSAALELLRSQFSVPVVGIEPGVKPAVQATRTGRIAILATDGTLAGQRFATLVQRFATNVQVQTIACHPLVEIVEQGDLTGEQTYQVVQQCLQGLGDDVDTIVLGCTHYHFLSPLIQAIAGSHVTIIDTALAVARQVARISDQISLRPGMGNIRCATTGNLPQIAAVLTALWETALPLSFADC
jgi:glutamate racemase